MVAVVGDVSSGSFKSSASTNSSDANYSEAGSGFRHCQAQGPISGLAALSQYDSWQERVGQEKQAEHPVLAAPLLKGSLPKLAYHQWWWHPVRLCEEPAAVAAAAAIASTASRTSLAVWTLMLRAAAFYLAVSCSY
ncbi:hypothetical protein JKP88DRAFT_253248 [Tribonema minus]|uniref:Uncharacterized protein n=1 Tax=Tribonema minus TaxID=303371 RepID=A0A835Z9C0_9STRA|nr:hypothetical protein JKP88DRAFT_253248 [Tribonema minus]